jgi:hypothetical protein
VPQKPKPPDELAEAQWLIKQISQTSAGLSRVKAKRLRLRLGELVAEIADLTNALDKFREPLSFFDPANPALVGSFVGIGLIAQARHPLDSISAFYGSGVYAIYYDGPHPAYKQLAKTEHPIYVGKADPDSPRAKKPREQGTGLFRRLYADHARAVRKVSTSLEIAHFSCRFLVVQSGWQTAAEDYLIDLFRPVWNDETRICWGIGKHGDSAEVRSNKRSPWDTMHPGRAWAVHAKLVDARPKSRIERDLAEHFSKYPPFRDVDDILKRFFDELKQK